jgi:hypothetical protein
MFTTQDIPLPDQGCLAQGLAVGYATEGKEPAVQNQLNFFLAFTRSKVAERF